VGRSLLSHARGVVIRSHEAHVQPQELVLVVLEALHARCHIQGAVHAVWLHGVWVHHLQARASAALCGPHVAVDLLDVRRHLLVVRAVGLVARLVHVLASGGPGLRVGVCLCLHLRRGEVHRHVRLQLLGRVYLVLQVLLWGALHHRAVVWRRVLFEIDVVVVAIGVYLVTLAGGKRHRFGFDGTAPPRLACGGERAWRQTSARTASRRHVTARQRLLRGHTSASPALADETAPLVDQAVVVPAAKVHSVLAQLRRGAGAQIDGDGRGLGGARRPAGRLEMLNLAAGVLELHLGLAAAVVGAGVAAQNLRLPALLARLIRLAAPVAVGVGDVAEQLLRVRVEQRRRGQRRGGVGGARRVDVADLAQALLGQQAFADLPVERLELLRAGRSRGPRVGRRKGRRREERRGRRQNLEAQRGEVERVGVEVEQGGARRLCARQVSERHG
jgi:hypothetical protein